MNHRSRGSALIEFALAWPIVLALVLGCVQVAIWATQALEVRVAALAGARAATVDGASSDVATAVALRTLAPGMFGVELGAWCPGDAASIRPAVWVCARDTAGAVEVTIGGASPSLLPLLPGAGLPLRADVVLQKEVFSR